jgi:hypothetical protein
MTQAAAQMPQHKEAEPTPGEDAQKTGWSIAAKAKGTKLGVSGRMKKLTAASSCRSGVSSV